MVLSNKKLKQKLRAAKAELITASQAENNNAGCRDFESKTSISLGNMLNLETMKTSLSKREKRRQNGVQDNGVIGNGDMSGGDVEPIQDGPKVDSVQVNKKKRKRDEDEASENGQEKKPQQLKKKKKKTKNKKKKPKINVEDGKVEEKGIDRNESGNTGGQLVVSTDEGIQRKNAEISSKVYVGGIPYYSTEDDIRSFFEGCGTITCIDCMTFPDTGKFRGIAIITFKTEAAAKRALAFDGSDMGGLFLKIQPFKAAKAEKLPDFCPSVLEGYNRIYVGNLSWDISEDDLKKLFADCTVKCIRFGEDKETGEFKGYAHVDFANNLSLTRALKLDQTVVCGRPVKISCAVPKKGNITKLTSTPKDDQMDSGKQGNTTELEATQKDSRVDNSYVNVDFENQVLTSETNAVSSKIRRRTCYKCGERGHLSSSCPKDDQVDSGKPGNTTELEDTQKDYKINYSYVNVDFENQVPTSETNAVSSKIRRRTCYECGERGHLSSSCPKVDQVDGVKQGVDATQKDNKVDYSNVNMDFENQAITSETSAVNSKIRRRTCYECGGRGHLSSSCPKVDQVDSVKQGSEATQKDNKVDYSNVNVEFENQVITSETNAVNSKIRRRTCYECGERGHLSSSCPKKQAADLMNQGTA